jgi:hypothetical protein
MSCVYVDWPLAGLILPTASQHKCMTHTNCCIYRVVSPDDEQSAYSKHVEVNYWNKLKINSESFCFLLYGYITMHCQQNIKFLAVFCTLILEIIPKTGFIMTLLHILCSFTPYVLRYVTTDSTAPRSPFFSLSRRDNPLVGLGLLIHEVLFF